MNLTWYDYCKWRRTKCPKRHLTENFDGSELIDPELRREIVLADKNEEICQATLEFIGEMSELAALLLDEDWPLSGVNRSALIDECGDVFFCGCWALDSWESNCLVERNQLELSEQEILIPNREHGLDVLASVLANVGLLANSCKKQQYQGISQNKATQQSYILDGLLFTAQVLRFADSTTEEALEYNMRKLNKRFPSGWSPGGGVR